jgi:hypothetical protein
MIENKDGCTVVTGEHIELFSMLSMRGMIKLELQGLSHSSGSVIARIKKRFNITARDKRMVLYEFENLIEKQFGKLEHRYTMLATNQVKGHKDFGKQVVLIQKGGM